MQILTAFLLTLPFQPAFKDLSDSRIYVYVGVLLSAMLSMLLLLSPVALHRALFHRGLRPWLVEAANAFSRGGLVLLVAANVGAVWLVLDVVLGVTRRVHRCCVPRRAHDDRLDRAPGVGPEGAGTVDS